MATPLAFRHPDRAGDEAAAPVVAFDFDGTLTCEDSFVAFLRWRAGPAGFALRLAAIAPAAARWSLDRDRGALKAAMGRLYFGGISRAQLAAEAQAFHTARSGRLMRPDALACWRDWRARGARLLIVTASPEILVAPFARALEADGLIGTRLAFDEFDRFTGALIGANCRGAEKVARLGEVLGESPRLAAAYGDTAGDREMLAIADAPGLKVFTARP